MSVNKRLGGGVLRNTVWVGLRALGLSTVRLLSVTTVRADTVLDWNVTALKITAAAHFNPPLESRNMAIVHAAMFDAVNSILREYDPYAIEPRTTCSYNSTLPSRRSWTAHMPHRSQGFPEVPTGVPASRWVRP